MPISMNYCAVHYLDQWLNLDKPLVDDIKVRRKKRQTIRLAATKYSVIRNMLLVGDVNSNPEQMRMAPVVDILSKHKYKKVTEENVVDRVEGFAEEVKNKYERNNLSFASKILWMLHRDSVLIYDENARFALENLNYTVPKNNYADFWREWHICYGKISDDIVRACAQLPNTLYVRHYEIPEKDVCDLASKKWFRRRVLDLYLWHEGREYQEYKDRGEIFERESVNRDLPDNRLAICASLPVEVADRDIKAG